MAIVPAAHVLLGSAFALALFFHRNRAAQVFAIAWLTAAALGQDDLRWQYGALRFAPWLMLAACLVPEPKLLSRRMAVFVLATALLSAITLFAPEHVFQALARGAAFLVLGKPAGVAAAAIVGLAAACCLLRWVMTSRPMELGIALALLPACIAFASTDANVRNVSWFALAAIGLMAVLYASYRMAFIDGLTGLPNRRALDETLMRLSGSYALAMVDIDHFKQFNDSHGHAAGDVVLRDVARTLARQAGGRAFRYGGEEFCVVFEGAGVSRAGPGCERARAAVEARRIAVPALPKKSRKAEPAPRDKRVDVAVTISVGRAERAAERRTPAEVLKVADQALYKAKAKGRNRVVAA